LTAFESILTLYLLDRPHLSRVIRNERLHHTDYAFVESYHSPVKPSLRFANGSRPGIVSKLDSIHILGSLILPDPSSNAHGEEILSMLKSIPPHIQALEKRDMKGKSSNIAEGLNLLIIT
jgi:hypothetical protein